MRSSLIRLGWSYLTVVAAGLATVLAVVWITFMPSVEQFYALEFGLPRLQQRYGFQFGSVTVSRDNVASQWEGILSVAPDGELARLGVRRHDVPFAHHGNGAAAFYHALMAGERGHVADFDVSKRRRLERRSGSTSVSNHPHPVAQHAALENTTDTANPKGAG